MERFNTYAGSIDAVLQQRPEVLKTVGMNATVHVLDGVIDNLVGVVSREPFVREKGVSVESRASFDMLADLS